eukprot:859052_1
MTDTFLHIDEEVEEKQSELMLEYCNGALQAIDNKYEYFSKFMPTSDVYCTHPLPLLPLKGVKIVFVLVVVWFVSFTAHSSTRKALALYNSLTQNQHSHNYIQIICTLVVTLFGAFVSRPRTLKLCLFLSFNLLISARAQYFDCIGYRKCFNNNIVCDQGNATVDCIIDCVGTDACRLASIYGGAGMASINCHGYCACDHAKIRLVFVWHVCTPTFTLHWD